MLQVFLIFLSLLLSGAAQCQGQPAGPVEVSASLADLKPVPLAAGEKLKVVATTTIVADFVRNVAGDLVHLTVMLPLGADPHTFSPTPQDIATVAEAHIVFSNGLHFETFMPEIIDNAGGAAVVIATTTGIEPRAMAEAEAHDEAGAEADHAPAEVDPHAWLAPANARVMVGNIASALRALDPAQAATYRARAEAYDQELVRLDGWVQEQIETIPVENREMVTDHDAFGYYADRYGLTIVGAIIPAYSTNAEPSAQELVALRQAISQVEARAIFVGTTINPLLAQQLAADTGLQLVPLYESALGEAGSGAETYLDYMRYNTTAIVTALR
jgi:ABC-type Zn uptake system ZnuABC Zn-binding protein ZnuA